MSVLFNGACYFQSSATRLPLAQASKTVCCWISITDTASLQTVFNAVDPALGIGYQIGLRSSLITIWSYGGTALLTATVPAVNTWVHLAYTYNAAHFLYFNGVQVATSTNANQTGQPSLCQLGGNQWGEYPRNAQVEDLRVYNRALTPAELLTIANANCRDAIANGLVAHWPMSEVVATQLAASDFMENYGLQSTLVGVAPFPVAKESAVLQRRTA